MSSKGSSIGKRLALSFGIVLLLTAVVGVVGFYGAGIMQDQTAKTVQLNELVNNLKQREIDHLNWAAAVGALLTDPAATELKVETDPHKCGFGKWYYSEERTAAEKSVPGLSEILASLEEPHKKLHESAVQIGSVFRKADVTLPAFLAARETDHLRWANKCLVLFAENLDALEVETDPTKCGLGKFLFGEHGQQVAASSPEMAAFLEKIKAPHEVLHKSAIAIKEKWNKADEQARSLAMAVFQEQTAPSLAETAAVLNEMKKLAEDEVSGVHAAEEVYSTQTKPALEEVQKNLKAAAELVGTHVTDTNALTVKDAGLIKMASGIVAAVGVVIGILLAYLMTRSLTSLLRRLIDSLTQSAAQVDSAASQVSQSSQTMAEGASEQASSLEETSASLEEMSSMTTQNADNAERCNALMVDAKQVVDGMSKATSDMLTAIREIKKSSDETVRIIKTIDEIAFQTNLLALNAAVEAARAGDAGKGFAVVAEEVRNLAQRSAEAAKNTSSLLEGSKGSSDNGVRVAERVSESLGQTVENISRVAELVQAITLASRQQATGIEQINVAISQMDKVTQSNAASSEEAASASEELSAQAKELTDMVATLAQLVGGTGNGNGAGMVRPEASARKQKSLVSAQTTGCRTGLAKMPQSESKAIRPQQVIPLDPEDLDEF